MKSIKLSRINMTNEVYNMYDEDCKTLLKEIKEDLNKQ